MTDLKSQLKSDLTTSMKARDELSTATIRMLLTAITNEEVSGSTARELSDDEVLRVITREAKKRREAAEAFDSGDRPAQAQRERDEETVLARYLPQQLGADELTQLVTSAIAESGATEPRQMGLVMKVLTPQIAGRADGKRVSEEVRRQLSA
ncbi:MAG: glutamyl-tRNA amidotransferase [Frankiales bacterium]|nr:glutamyl-tRNA amidotransferase [Frankiales bacterium]